MSVLHLDSVSLSVAGGAVLLLGLANTFLTLRRSSNPWRLPLALAGVFALLGGLSWAFSLPAALTQSALLLAGIEAFLALLQVPSFSAGRSAFALVKGSAFQAGCVLLAGSVLLGSQMHRIDSDLESNLCQGDYDLAQASDPISPNAPPAMIVHTDAGRPIPLYTVSPSAIEVDQATEDRYLRGIRLDWKVIRTGSADIHSNCHGWTFTGGRYWVRSVSVPTILEDNKYEVVTQPQPGDLAVWSLQGNVTHTGVVRGGGEDSSILIESKWGKMARFIHTDTENPYTSGTLTYYRSPRGPHALKGQGSSKPNVQITTPFGGS